MAPGLQNPGRRMRERASILLCASALAGCFDPGIDDGAVRCGEAGCPPGLVCTAEEVCRTSGGEDTNLVLAVARADLPAQLHASCAGHVALAWQLDNVPGGQTVAWGRDEDGEQLLVIGSVDDDLRVFTVDHDEVRQLWSLDWMRQARSSGWADFDHDGDVDLAISDGEHSLKVLEQRRGGLEAEWRAQDMTEPWGLAWGDLDGDGDADLAAAADDAIVYRNHGDDFEPAWTSPRHEGRRSVVWGDLDGDGDLELITGSQAGPVRVYRNDGGQLVEAWASAELGDVPALAVGDLDGDGDLDLAAAGRDGPTRVYRNDRGQLRLAWSTETSENTWSVDWFDVDDDGDLDLTLGNHDQASRVVRNDGGALRDWQTLDVDRVHQLAWARWPVEDGHPSACDAVRWRDDR